MNRPNGSRPAPFSRYGSAMSSPSIESGSPQDYHNESGYTCRARQDDSTTEQGHARANSWVADKGPSAERPLAKEPKGRAHARGGSIPVEDATVKNKVSYTYMESGTRWMEKQETKSLTQALYDMDLAEDKRVHQAAQDEAAVLVWKHQNPNATYSNPDLRRDYRSHLRKGSYNQAHTSGAVRALGSRSSSGSSQDPGTEDVSRKSTVMKRKSKDVLRKITPPSLRVGERRTSAADKPYGELAEMVRKDIAVSRRTSSGSRRMMSGSKKGYMHPDDKIWEDEQEKAHTSKLFQQLPDLKPPVTSAVPSYTRRNPFARVRVHHDKLERANSAPLLGQPVKTDGPGPGRNQDPMSSLSDDILPTLAAIGHEAEIDEVPMRDGLEIRSSDIRAATSKRRSDRSPNLPQPTIVSDRHQRPIVSFRPDLRLQAVVTKDMEASTDSRGQDFSTSSRPGSSTSVIVRPTHTSPIPTIHFPDEDVTPKVPAQHARSIPMICLPDEDQELVRHRSEPAIPQISFSPPAIAVQAPMIQVTDHNEAGSRPLPVPVQRSMGSARPRSTPHYSPSVSHSGILCAHCALPIAGRVLSAAGQRFHPGCFVCHECNTNLELVAFYPEPENKRQERVARIHARRSGNYDYFAEGECEATALQREADDGDESLRFYCHLDFHELYSPRCKSCKTPIEGEVIVACGAEWHAGHFFCAQCGDPFDSTTPFVEKEGYAWCVGCHTNRFSSKCRKCKKPITEVVVKALGVEWHSHCFCCIECNGPFDDGRYFLRGDAQEPVCVKCEERRLKA